jgi:hypothetical protein
MMRFKTSRQKQVYVLNTNNFFDNNPCRRLWYSGCSTLTHNAVLAAARRNLAVKSYVLQEGRIGYLVVPDNLYESCKDSHP